MDRDALSALPLFPQFTNTEDNPQASTQPASTAPVKANSRSDSKAKSKSKATRASSVAKTFVVDTNVLLHDPACLQRFEDNHVAIPVDVLSELDRFKGEPSERGANAREVHRTLSAVFSQQGAAITEGVPTLGGGSVRLAVYDASESKSPTLQRFRRLFPDTDKIDHRILACALSLSENASGPVILITKDLNMQLKARAIGLICEDYLHDKVEVRDVANLDLLRFDISPHELQRFASSGVLELPADRLPSLEDNEYVLLSAGDRQTIPARFRTRGGFQRLHLPEALRIHQGRSIKPMNLGQQCFLDALLDPEITLVTCYGQAGTGKTLLAVAAALTQVFDHTYNGLTISRPIVAMGQTVGFLPGSLQDKMRPWLQPVYDALDLLMRPIVNTQGPQRKKNKHQAPNEPQQNGVSGQPTTPYDGLIQQGILEIEALCYIRGRSIPDRFFVLDEAQQLTPLEAKTVVTRMSRGSKLVLIGDPAQIDNPYVDSRSNGLVYTRQRMRGQPFAAHVPLLKGERSPLAEAGARLL
jgi:PhoH-like ATPase